MNRLTHRGKKVAVIGGAILIAGIWAVFLLFFTTEEEQPEQQEDEDPKTSLIMPFQMDPGSVSRFEVSYNQNMSGEFPDMNRSGQVKRQNFQTRISFEGELLLRVYEKESARDRFFVGARLKSIKMKSQDSSKGKKRKTLLEKTMKNEIFFSIGRKGALQDFYFPPSVRRQSIILWQWLLDTFVPVVKHSRKMKWSAQHTDIFGIYEAQYTRNEEFKIERQKQKYAELMYFPAMSPEEFTVDGSSTYTFTNDGRSVKRGSGEVEIQGGSTNGESRFQVNFQRKFTMELQERAVQDQLLSALLERKGFEDLEQLKNHSVLFGPGEFPNRKTSSRSAPDTELSEVVTEVKREPDQEGSVRNRREQVRKLISHIQHTPEETVSYITDQIESSETSSEAKRRFITSLYLSQSVEAFQAIANLLEKDDFSEEGFLIEGVWMVEQPTRRLKKAIKERVERTSPNSEHFSKELRAAGVLASRYESQERGDDLVESVLDKEPQLETSKNKLGFLDALGNSRRAVAFRKGREYLFGENIAPQVKVGAIRSIEHGPDPVKASRILLEYAQDEAGKNSPIMRALVSSIVRLQDKQHPDLPLKEVESFLKEQVLESPNNSVRYEALGYFANHLENNPDYTNLLQKVANGDPNSNVRKRAQSILPGRDQ